jgi:hypothetical protein
MRKDTKILYWSGQKGWYAGDDSFEIEYITSDESIPTHTLKSIAKSVLGTTEITYLQFHTEKPKSTKDLLVVDLTSTE